MQNNPYDFFFRTLANRKRLAIVHALQAGEQNVTQLVRQLRMNQTTLSHHLQRLLRCQFVHVRQENPARYYSLNRATIRPLLQLIDRHVNRYCRKACVKCLPHHPRTHR